MYYIAICDDDHEYITYMKKMLLRSGLEEEEVLFYEYISGENMRESLKRVKRIDLLILDMQMKLLGGNETARVFRKAFPSAILVFCSGVYLPTVESFRTLPFRYLLKEYSDDKMIFELKAVAEELKRKAVEPVIVGKWKQNEVNLKPDEVLYISIARNGSHIHIHPAYIKYEFEQYVLSREKLSELYLLLRDYGFEYAHNSYIVNMNYIKRRTVKELELADGTILSIARSKEKQLRSAFAKYKSRRY